MQSSTRSGFFPFNKYSSVPLLMAAARKAASDSQKTGDNALNDSRDHFMPNLDSDGLIPALAVA